MGHMTCQSFTSFSLDQPQQDLSPILQLLLPLAHVQQQPPHGFHLSQHHHVT